MKCKICKSTSSKLFKLKVLNKYSVAYYQCPNCDFIQTEKPFWLKEAYQNPINICDTGIVTRNVNLAKKTALFLKLFRNHKANFLDYAGGYGLFTRLMRDVGFDFYWNDPYTKSLFSIGFEGDSGDNYEAITAFELFEHLDNPLKEIETLITNTDTLIFSTLLTDTIKSAELKRWWYLGPQHGQHISFYSKKTLSNIALKLDINLITNNKNYHIFTKKKTSQWAIRLVEVLTKLDIGLLNKYLINKRSLTFKDHKKLIDHHL
ncbi:MAG TPA: hypothetical protein DCP10_04510 [Bacteroidales bacterium]|nr:hypothetical protein [Bacteroidales bacterium]